MLFQVPPGPSVLHVCSIINISYSLVFVVVPKGPSSNFETHMLIIIGSIPLKDSFGALRPQPSAPASSDLLQPGPSSLVPRKISDQYPELRKFGSIWIFNHSKPCTVAPPSYEECVNGAVVIRDPDDSQQEEGEELKFAPRYMYYGDSRNNQSTSKQ